MEEKKSIKVRIYQDNRVVISLHPYQTTLKKKKLLPKSPYEDDLHPLHLMTRKNYIRQLNAFHKRLWERDFSTGKYYFITLTLKQKLSLEKLIKEFHRFVVYLRRKFNKIEYFRAIEHHNDYKRLHIHLILQLQEDSLPCNHKVITKLWGLGHCQVKPITNIRHAIVYLTKSKEDNIHYYNYKYTYFPIKSRILSCSNNFGKKIEEYRDEFITHSQYYSIMKKSLEEKQKDRSTFIRVDRHTYLNYRECELMDCIDKVYLVLDKEFVSNNF